MAETFRGYAQLIHLATLQSNLRRPARPLRMNLTLARKAAKFGQKQIVDRFTRMVAPDGTPWEPTKAHSKQIFEAKFGYPHTGYTGRATQQLYVAIRKASFIRVSRTAKGIQIVFGANLNGRLAEKARLFSTGHRAVVFGTVTGNTVPGRPFLGLNTKDEKKMSRIMSSERLDQRRGIARLRSRNTQSKSTLTFFIFP